MKRTILKNNKKIVLPKGASIFALIITSLILYLALFVAPAISLIIYGTSISKGLLIFSYSFIVLIAIIFMLFNIKIMYLLRLEFIDDNVIINYFTVPAKIIKRTKTVISLLGICKIERLKGKTLLIIYENGCQNTIQLKSFSNNQISKIILNLNSNVNV